MAIKRVRATVTGRVQGVYFRTYTQDEAQKLGVAGWVRNLPDGSVEAAIEGDSDKVDQMVNWLKTGTPMAEVKSVETTEETPLNEQSAFNIRYN
jgi:acylphosphatase